MADSFPRCTISRAQVEALEARGLLLPPAQSGWRLEEIGGAPAPRADEVVVLAPFFDCGFTLPLHPFVRGLLFFYGLELHHLHPNSVLHIACFITLCEAFLGTAPHFSLWCYLFRPQLSGGQGTQRYVWSVTL